MAALNMYTMNEQNIGLAYFEKLKMAKPIFRSYKPETLYRAYIMEYIILLWDNAYYFAINTVTNRTKVRGINEELLGKEFIDSVGYAKLVALQDYLENTYFTRYSLIRYLTQAWSNYLFNKYERYRYIPLNRIYSDKVKAQYYELSKGLFDKTVRYDNLSFTTDPVTIALLNYYYYLDESKYADMVQSFELSLTTAYDDKLESQYNKVKETNNKAMIINFINAVGLNRDVFTASYGDTLILNNEIMTFNGNDILQQQANNYLASGGHARTDLITNLTLALSNFGTYDKLLRVLCKNRLECSPLTDANIKNYRELGFNISNIKSLNLD
ncbi:MAG: hypothetical protein [Bacteriophage sp.]|nr:MAG: hypothetical protein [Bacteriophage sp.]